MSYRVEVNKSISGEHSSNVLHFDSESEAIEAFNHSIDDVYEEFNSEFMRNFGCNCSVFLIKFENKIGTSVVASTNIKRPLHSPKATKHVCIDMDSLIK
jgi:hypothetical protein